jgi:DNA-binding MarR family transcriptional regulator
MVCFATYSLSLEFMRFYKPYLQELGLTYPQYLVMLQLWQKDNQIVSEIGAPLGLDSSTLSPLLKKLEAAKLVARSRDVEDERKTRITMTAQGKALESKAAHIPSCVVKGTGRSVEDLLRLIGELTDLKRSLSE